MSDEASDIRHHLRGPDADAVDALFEAGFDPAKAKSAAPDRVARAASLLRLLDTRAGDASTTLVDLTMARVLRSTPHHATDQAGEDVLTSDSIEALDAYVASGFRVGAVAPSLRPMAEVVDRMVALVADSRDGVRIDNSLAERTLERVRAAPSRLRPTYEPQMPRASGGFRIQDLVSVAAVILIGVAVLWPVLSTVRAHQMKSNCVANMGSVASAMSMYAGDHTGSLPLATASMAGTPWWDVGLAPARSNSANLFTLPRLGYTAVESLACPGNARGSSCSLDQEAQDWKSVDDVSYSYYVMFSKQRPTWERSSATIVLADRSPVILRAVRGQPIYDMENSPNHRGTGQWALRADGASVWLNTPKAGEDNIWLPAPIEAGLREYKARYRAGERGFKVLIKGDESPASDADSFVGP